GAKKADLVVVARVVDPGMQPLLAAAGIDWLPGVARADLNWYFRRAQAFVLPSLSEGFGQVYLEALANGCPVIGTRHSVLPDAVAARAWIRFVEPGDVEGLAESLADTLRRPAPAEAERAQIAASVSAFTWERFR